LCEEKQKAGHSHTTLKAFAYHLWRMVWQAWLVPWAPLWRWRNNCLAKIKICDLYFVQPLFCAPYKR